MVEKPVVEHIRRAASFPWRAPEAHLTECGLEVARYADRVISPQEYKDRLRIWGERRTAMATCQTCAMTCSRYRPWAEDPVDAVRREVWGHRGDQDRFRDELRALAALVEAHRTEFDTCLTGLADVPSLAERRQARRGRR